MAGITDVKEHMEVVGNDNQHVGTVDRVEGNRIKLTKKDSGPGHTSHHHFLPGYLVDRVEGGKVRLLVRASEALKQEQEAWGSESQSAGRTSGNLTSQARHAASETTNVATSLKWALDESIRDRPYTTLIAAGVVGFIYAVLRGR